MMGVKMIWARFDSQMYPLCQGIANCKTGDGPAVWRILQIQGRSRVKSGLYCRICKSEMVFWEI